MSNTITLMKLDDIIPYENNPRHNDEAVDMVAKSIQDFGFRYPILVDKNNVIISGHTRLKASYKLGLSKVPVMIADDLTDDKVKALRLVDNRTSEVASWDFDLLQKELDAIEMDMNQYKFDYDELMVGSEEDIVEDNPPEPDEENEPTAKRGDIWILGNHRLMCGDSTSEEDVKKLMNGKQADLLETDPPYNIAYGTKEQQYKEKGYKVCMKDRTIMNDNMSSKEFREFLTNAFKRASDNMKAGASFYVWLSSKEEINFETSLNRAGLYVKQQLIWNKSTFTLGRQDYQWKHEPCLYGWKDGAPHYFVDSRTEMTVYEDKKPNINKMSKQELKDYIKELLEEKVATTVINVDKPSRSEDHPTMKPLKLIGYQVKNSSRKGDIVLDLFGGSGSTLMACEQLGRICYTMELDPKFVDVIIKRWETLTGKKAELLKE